MGVRTIAVDLDGTLAEHEQGKFKGIEHIGRPIMAMVYRVRAAIEAGCRVVIFTARADPRRPNYEEAVKYIKIWCRLHIGRELEVTAIKDRTMSEFWDDRAVGVVCNGGMAAQPAEGDGSIWASLERAVWDLTEAARHQPLRP
jgi:hypothetical protein